MADSPVTALISSASCSTDSPSVLASSSAPHTKGSSEEGVSDKPSTSVSEISMDQPPKRKKDEKAAKNARGTGKNSEKGQDLRRKKEADQRERKEKARDVDKRKEDEVKKGCYGNVLCKCAAGVTADCAAVCCCPLAILHLGVLALVRLPTAVLWKMLVSMNGKLFQTRKASRKADKNKEMERGSPEMWSCPDSPETATVGQIRSPDARFSWEILSQKFQTEELEFGGFVHKSE